jgi:hypothetical protein
VRWIATRRPRTYLLAGWILFALGCYPGYLSTDGILQLYTVRSGDFSDYAPVMSALWSLLEYVLAGPFPMLALQSGLFLFGAFAILRTVLTPRAAAITAGLVLLFPPVFGVFAVIWPEPLMAGALIAATGAVLQPNPRWKLGAIGFAILACACRMDAVVAVFPIALAVLSEQRKLRRAGLALAITIGIGGVAWIADYASTVTDTYVRQNDLQLMDVVGTLRRAKVHDETALHEALAGIPVADPATLHDKMSAGNDALNARSLTQGDKKIFDPIDSDEEADATAAAWRGAILSHPGAYLVHRWAMARSLLAIRNRAKPVYDQFGNPDLLAPLHHRATPSDWELGMQKIVRGFAATPLFRPYFYLLLAIVVIVLARRRPLLRNLAIAGLAYELAMCFCAPTADYRYSHFFVAAVSLALAGVLVRLRGAWRSDSV